MLVLHAGAFVREGWYRHRRWPKLPPCRRCWICDSSVRSHNILGQVHVECRTREMFLVKLHVFWLDSRSQLSALLSTGRCPAKGRRVVGEPEPDGDRVFCLVSCVRLLLVYSTISDPNASLADWWESFYLAPICPASTTNTLFPLTFNNTTTFWKTGQSTSMRQISIPRHPRAQDHAC
jgi:hypothetical protein